MRKVWSLVLGLVVAIAAVVAIVVWWRPKAPPPAPRRRGSERAAEGTGDPVDDDAGSASSGSASSGSASSGSASSGSASSGSASSGSASSGSRGRPSSGSASSGSSVRWTSIGCPKEKPPSISAATWWYLRKVAVYQPYGQGVRCDDLDDGSGKRAWMTYGGTNRRYRLPDYADGEARYD